MCAKQARKERNLKPKGILLRPLSVVIRETVKHTIHSPNTVLYPWERLVIADGYRGRPGLVMDRCIQCYICVKICPTRCIELVEIELEGKKLKRPQINLGRCMMCGYCAEYCPKNALIMAPEYELAGYTRQDLIYDPFKLVYEAREGCEVNVIEVKPSELHSGIVGTNVKTGKGIRDTPEVEDKKCIGCSKCEKVCPTNAVEMIQTGVNEKGRPIKRPKFDEEKCVSCEQCLDNCPKDAIKMKEVK
jgi:NADH-quinone oxidoreductase subunit I/NAD(P)H-quinone oxidoreductase subunit I